MIKFIKKNPIVFAIICMLITVILVAACSRLTDGFQNFDPSTIFQRDLNEDNLLHNSYENLESYSHPSGVSFKNKNGTIEMNGKIKEATGATDVQYVLTTVELQPGTYTYTCFEKPTMTSYYSFIRYDDETGADHIVFADFDNSNIVIDDVTVDGYKTFTLDKATEVEIVLVACVGADIDVDAHPCLVSGTEAGEFFAK